jgi:hypothetical protein
MKLFSAVLFLLCLSNCGASFLGFFNDTWRSTEQIGRISHIQTEKKNFSPEQQRQMGAIKFRMEMLASELNNLERRYNEMRHNATALKTQKGWFWFWDPNSRMEIGYSLFATRLTS